MAKLVAVTDQDFDKVVLESDLPVLVDFWADWCGPCKIVAPIVEQIAEDYDGRVVVAKLDVDANPLAASTYGVRSIPTLIFFKDGKPVDQIIGAASKAVLKEHLDRILA